MRRRVSVVPEGPMIVARQFYWRVASKPESTVSRRDT
jgi:hypothetical protein